MRKKEQAFGCVWAAKVTGRVLPVEFDVVTKLHDFSRYPPSGNHCHHLTFAAERWTITCVPLVGGCARGSCHWQFLVCRVQRLTYHPIERIKPELKMVAVLKGLRIRSTHPVRTLGSYSQLGSLRACIC